MVTFNVDEKEWIEFLYIAKKNGTNGSKELRKFIKKYLEDNKK